MRIALRTLTFAMEVAEWQIKEGRFFLPEHPASARS
jgi:hypothetical protein